MASSQAAERFQLEVCANWIFARSIQIVMDIVQRTYNDTYESSENDASMCIRCVSESEPLGGLHCVCARTLPMCVNRTHKWECFDQYCMRYPANVNESSSWIEEAPLKQQHQQQHHIAIHTVSRIRRQRSNAIVWQRSL